MDAFDLRGHGQSNGQGDPRIARNIEKVFLQRLYFDRYSLSFLKTTPWVYIETQGHFLEQGIPQTFDSDTRVPYIENERFFSEKINHDG